MLQRRQAIHCIVFNCPAAIALLSIATMSFAGTGMEIYRQGQTEAGLVTIGDNTNQAPATLFPCINCHLEQGSGSKESGVTVPNITWRQLSRPYRKDADGAKPRAPYRYESFKQALTNGIDSDGSPLSNAMPRYVLNDAEISSLIDHLRQIDQPAQAGVEDDKIHIALRLPEQAELAAIVKETLSLYASELNRQGGVYRRRLVLYDSITSEAGVSTFCVLDLRMRFIEAPEQVPQPCTLGIFAPAQQTDSAYYLYDHPSTFHLHKQAIVKAHGFLPLPSNDTDVDTLVKTIQGLTAAQLKTAILIHEPANTSLQSLLTTLLKTGAHPRILADLASLTPEIEKLIAAYPTDVYAIAPPGLESVSKQGRRQLSELANSFKAPKRHLTARLWSLTLMNLLLSALQQTGKDLTEQKFLRVLQSQVDLNTDFGPLLTYSANRRIGHSGSLLLKLN